jgi:energy-coupling factor transport system substrate-specific component
VLAITARDAFILVFGILFGPAGAWGTALGNGVGDFLTGSLGTGSVFGFLANFLVAFLGAALWARMKPKDRGPAAGSPRLVAAYVVIGLLTAPVGALTLAFGLNALGLAPFRIVALSLLVNLVVGSWAGALLHLLLADRVEAIGMTWTAVLDVDEPTGGPPVRGGLLGAGLFWLGLALVLGGGAGGYVLAVWVCGGAVGVAVAGVGVAAVLAGAAML